MSRPRIFGALLLACLAQSAAALGWQEPWVPSHDAQQAAANSDEYAWHLFVALNWPADLRRRTADRGAKFGADRPVVWETWRNTADVYRDDGRDPGPWVAGGPLPDLANEDRFETLSLTSLPNVRHVVAGRMVPLADPVANAKRLTEIRMNRTAFDYLRARGLYSLDGQLEAVADGSGVHFPFGATEVKAKWRPIGAAERARYHTVTVRLADGSTRLYGLTALHIVSKDLPQWFWATFEHVDNASLTDGEGWQLPSSDRFACRGADADCNRAPPGIGLEGTVWSYYRLRGTLTRFVDAADRPLRLANSELEAGLQKSSSCITCHSRSSIAVVAGAPLRLPIFDTSDGAPHDVLDRRGYMGPPRAAWFRDSGGQPLFQQLDFVWSLSKAQPRRGP
jgi:hypothetical protein